MPFFFNSKNVTKNWTFLLFTVFLGFFWLFTFSFLPETKNKKVEEITSYFENSKNLIVFRARNSNHVEPNDDEEGF
jgi:hypothetical protein